jgi:GNAT superfamily N-acetyltransferase
VVDGWIVRFADGYTRRANSVNPLYAPQGDVEKNIAACEALFAARDLRPTFKLTAAAEPPDLDALLRARGYAREAETSVQTLAFAPRPPATAPLREKGSGQAPALTDEWFAAHVALSGLAPAHYATAYAMLTMLGGASVTAVPGGSHAHPPTRPHAHTLAPPAACFAHVAHAGQPIACGLAVAERGHVGVFDIAVHPAHRRQGHARRLMLDLLAWGQARGAHTAYLQVMGNNAAALALYAGLGFAEQYRYWYRVNAV